MNCQKGCQPAAGGLPADTGNPLPACQERVSPMHTPQGKTGFSASIGGRGTPDKRGVFLSYSAKNCGILIGRSGFSGHVYAGRLCALAGRLCRKGLPSASLWARPKEAGRQKTAQAASGGYGSRPVWFVPLGADFIKLLAAPGGGQIVLRLFLPLPAGRTPLILLPLCGIL